MSAGDFPQAPRVPAQPRVTGSGAVGTAMYGPAGAGPAGQARAQPRRANLVVARVDPWSVMKFGFLASLAAWVVLMAAVALLYFLLSKLGVFSSLQTTLQSVTSSKSSGGLQLSTWVSPSKVFGYTMFLGAIDVVLITVLAAVGAVIYNAIARLGGGIQMTLREGD